ncbi:MULTISPECIES: hypothetical protein [unclassified Luteococcus]|uniref:hypothetical protein n=1 Tax=unclassified Luteococcus TaxID=2639923 RepID=UPI00313CBEBA
MSTIRTMSSLAASAALVGGLALAPALASSSSVSPAPQKVVAQKVATKKPTAKKARPRLPWMSIGTWHKVKGRTLTYRYAEAGYQYKATDGRRSYALKESAGYYITFGDGTSDGGDGLGGLSCLRKGTVVKFQGKTPNLTHRYAKPGRYKVTVKGYYCGTKKPSTVTRSYWVTVR